MPEIEESGREYHNTIKAYMTAYRQYEEKHFCITWANLLKYKAFLIEKYKPKTVNLRIHKIHCCLEFEGKESMRLPLAKAQQKTYLENVISEADYVIE